MTILRAAALAVAVASIVSGCGFADTDLKTVIERPGYSFYLRVYDDTGLVTEVQPGPAPDPATDGTATAYPDREWIVVSWTGGACNRTPTINVSGSSSDLLISVEPDASRDLLPHFEGCPTVGIPLTATLLMSTPVLQEDIRTEIAQ